MSFEKQCINTGFLQRDICMLYTETDFKERKIKISLIERLSRNPTCTCLIQVMIFLMSEI